MSASADQKDWKAIARKRLGRLAALGLEELWQAALLLPSDWDDLTCVVSQFDNQEMRDGRRAVFRGRVRGKPATRFDRVPRLVGYLTDDQERRLGWTVFGDNRELAARFEDQVDHAVIGTLTWFHGWWLRDCEFVPDTWVGRLMPRYPGKRQVIAPETVRERIQSLLPTAIPIAADWLADKLHRYGNEASLCQIAGVPDWTLPRVLTQAHTPDSVESGTKARRAMERLAALDIVDRAADHDNHVRAASWNKPSLDPARIGSLPFRLTPDQTKAVKEISEDLRGGRAMRRMLTGDVGTGKTAVYGLAAQACLDGGGRVAVLLPNQALADQVAREFSAWWPDSAPVLVLGGGRAGDEELGSARFIVGTTAILQREAGKFDLVVVDEQHKFSREQREEWIGNAHLLEVSATCIPRSQALVEFGMLKLSRLHTGHATKQIHTRIWSSEDRAGLFSGVRATLAAGYQVLVIYPRRGDDEPTPSTEESASDLPSVEEAYAQWERLFPGKVRLTHGGMDDTEIASALRDIREGRANILISTTVVEVGLNLPQLRRVVVVHAERFGIVTLHQLRGRVARLGGTGYCDLFLPRPVKEGTLKRLQVLEETNDGFRVASCDLALRGFGDLGCDSATQHGADDVFLFGCHVAPETIEGILDVLDKST